jgi:acetyl esterase
MAAKFQIVEYAYQRDPNLLVRVYQPEGKGPFPCIVDVHGGGWGSGDRFSNASLNEALAGHGILVAALDFRLSNVAKFPASVIDVNTGIRWLKSNAESFGGRAEFVGGLGTSSGGHQLLLNALSPDNPRFCMTEVQKKFDASLRFVVACWPVADPWARYQMAREKHKQNLLNSHSAYWNSEEEMRWGSPQLMIERGEFSQRPPMLILQGDADDNLTPDMAQNFASAYAKVGGSVEVEIFPQQSHAFITRSPEADASRRAIAKIATFIKSHSTNG